MVMKCRRRNWCVHNLCGCGSEGCLLGVCSKLNLQVQKANRALRLILPWSVTLDKFFYAFPCSSGFPLPSDNLPPFHGVFPSTITDKTPDDIPYALLEMIPLVPTLALAFLSFTCSVFIILRIVIPILPPHPLSRRVAPVRSIFLILVRLLTWLVYSPNLAFRTSGS